MTERKMQKWVAGTRKVLTVLRQVDPYGHFLGDGFREVLLPKGEQTGPLVVGGPVEVFIYHDSEDRWVATMNHSLIEAGKIAALEIVDQKLELGFFLDIGLKRQLLLPRSELSDLEFLRPKLGDRVYVKMEHDQRGRMIAACVIEDDLIPICVPAPLTWRNTWVEGIVYNTMKIGSFVLCDAGVLGFGVIGMIHESERPLSLRIGERVRVRVTHVRDDGRVNLSLRDEAHLQQNDDASLILNHLIEQKGAMPYSDKTDPELIKKTFKMSKAAFKRALGALMKQGQIRQEGEWTYRAEGKGTGGVRHE